MKLNAKYLSCYSELANTALAIIEFIILMVAISLMIFSGGFWIVFMMNLNV